MLTFPRGLLVFFALSSLYQPWFIAAVCLALVLDGFNILSLVPPVKRVDDLEKALKVANADIEDLKAKLQARFSGGR